MNLSRIHRLLKLIGLLQSGKGYNADALARQCEVSRRTIFRDLSALRQGGVPVLCDELRGHYHIRSTYFLPPTNLTAEEALAVIVLCHELGDRNRLPFYQAAHSAAMKLENCLPVRLREQLRGVTGAVKIKLAPVNPLVGRQSVYDRLVDAIGRRRCVRITYASLTENETIRTKLRPYQLFFSRRSWYVVGRSSLHRAKRTFNVGRIRRLDVLDETFRIPHGFSLAAYLRNAWHLIPERGPDRRVLIRFSKMVAQNVAEVAWHKTQRTIFNDDGTLDFHVTVSGLGEISWWVLGYGDQAEVVSPPELRNLVARRAAEMVKLYRGG